jgi:hypothetical protein
MRLPLSLAETTLIELTARGDECELGTSVPEVRRTTIGLEVGFLRFLALGGNDNTPVHKKGLPIGQAARLE